MAHKPWEQFGVKTMPHGKVVKVRTLLEDYMLSERYRALMPNSKSMYNSIIKNLVSLEVGDSVFMDMKVSEVTYAFADYVKKIYTRSLKPASVSLYFSVLSSIWSVACRHGKAAINPWEKARIKVVNFREVTWSQQEIATAVSKAKEMGFHLLATYISVAYMTGQRPWNDLRELKWSNVKTDLDGNLILDFTISKTNTRLMLPLSQDCIDILEALPRTGDYIFVTSKGARLTSAALSAQLSKVKVAAGLSSELLMRDLRRSAVTELAMSGATAQEITAVTGWRATDRVISRYAVMRSQTAKNAIAKREQFMRAYASEAISESQSISRTTEAGT